MKKTNALIILATALCLAPTAYASTSIDPVNSPAWNKHTGAYVEVNVGTNLAYLGVFSNDGSTSNALINGGGYSIALGYNFTTLFAVEGGFMQNYVDFDKYFDDSDKDPSLRHTNLAYTSMVFTVPMGNRFSFIGKLGAMFPIVDGEVAVLPYTGIGFGYAVTKNLEVTAQYQGAVYGIVGAGLLSGGMIYHF